ncbi:GMC oxidoreductase [Karstenula rhodostoma CBS 690.94]|uniref:GMC oxidoreductase n=1 Tax=Karstenula rhodostoma CBS 690.94 TaxID=1392251 RepID=A0A9P4PLA3_9PLEO|nr:GMC oxidoreductase [Karstenula rhodostoma CBS 690.94]
MPDKSINTDTEGYDYILVGVGSASCWITSRLSQLLPDHQSLVLEAGEHRRDYPKVQTPGLSSTLQSNPLYDWQYASAPEPGLNNRCAINSHSVWSSQGMQDCYKRWQVESSEPGVNDDVRSLDHAFEELGHPTEATEFSESSPGAVTVTNAVDSSNGERSHAAISFLELYAIALAAAGGLNSTGVRYTYHREELVVTAGEIILCAAVFGSPAILERSGIGSKKFLAAANVPILYELPRVGKNLQDHLNCSLSCETQDHIHTCNEAVRNHEESKAALMEYERSRTGRMSEAPYETQELTESVKHWVEDETNPSLRAQYAVIQKTVESPIEATATTFILLSQRSQDTEFFPKGTPPFVDGNYPEIRFNYLTHPLDMEILARHLGLIERLFQKPTFTAIAKPNGRRLPRSFPYPISSLEDVKAILPINAATNYHPSSTCSMMRKDLGGVVDERLRMIYSEAKP